MYATTVSKTTPGLRRLLALCCVATIGLMLLVATGAARAAAPGAPDTTFGSGGLATVGSDIKLLGATFQSDGKLVAVGERGVGSKATPTLVVARLTTSGGLDGSFGGGVVSGPAITTQFGNGSLGRAVAVQSDGKVVVVGKATSVGGSGSQGMLIERFNTNGSLDAGFGSHGVVDVLTGTQGGDGYSVAIQPDGKILAGGSAASATGASSAAVVRLNTNGTLDSSFDTVGTAQLSVGLGSIALGVAVQSDGKIVVAGSTSPGQQVVNTLLLRLTSSGAPDSSFAGTGPDGKQLARGAANSAFNAVAIQKNGSIVVAGANTDGNQGADALFARFTSSGGLDGSFGSGGVTYETSASNTIISGAVPGARGVAIAANGDIIGGGTINSSGTTYGGLWALGSGGALDGGFGSGGRVQTGPGGVTNLEGNGLAEGLDGRIALVGDTNSFITSAYTGAAAAYGGFGPIQPPCCATPPIKVSLIGLKGTQKISTFVKHGLKVKVGCNEACSLRVMLGISAGTARQLKILTAYRRCRTVHHKRVCQRARGYRATSLASGRATLRAAGTKTFTLRVNRSIGRTLGKQRKKVKMTLQVIGTSTATHKTAKISRGLTFKR